MTVGLSPTESLCLPLTSPMSRNSEGELKAEVGIFMAPRKKQTNDIMISLLLTEKKKSIKCRETLACLL